MWCFGVSASLSKVAKAITGVVESPLSAVMGVVVLVGAGNYLQFHGAAIDARNASRSSSVITRLVPSP